MNAPFYKRWWFWVAVVVIIAAAAGNRSRGNPAPVTSRQTGTIATASPVYTTRPVQTQRPLQTAAPVHTPKPTPTPEPTEKPEPTPKPEPTEKPEPSAAAENVVRPEVKRFLDAYETCMNEYAEFMKKYLNADPAGMAAMMGDYYKILAAYTEYSEKLDMLDESELTEAELAYYIAVTGRVSQKLLAVASY